MRKIVEHGETVKVDSQPGAGGTRFCSRYPVQPDEYATGKNTMIMFDDIRSAKMKI